MIVDQRPATADWRQPAAPLNVDLPSQPQEERPAETPAPRPGSHPQDLVAIDRCPSEAGRIYENGRAARSIGRAHRPPSLTRGAPRPHVLIVGAGVAALEALLAMRALAGAALDISWVAPELTFADHAAAVRRPFEVPHTRPLRLADVARDLDARWHRATIDRIDHREHRVITTDRDHLEYDHLVVAFGARCAQTWQSHAVLTFGATGGDARNSFPVLLHQLRTQQIKSIAFVRPPGENWPTPMYDLALLTAACCAAHDLPTVSLTLLTPESRPLDMFGTSVSATLQLLLDEAGVTLRTSSDIQAGRRGSLQAPTTDRTVPVDRVVTQPRLIGPRLRGMPCGPDGFIEVEPDGSVTGLDDVYAAGDGTDSPLKFRGHAAEQADAVAATLAMRAGVGIAPRPSTPARDLVFTDARPCRTRCPSAHDVAVRLQEWSVPNAFGVRHLGPYGRGPCDDILGCAPHAIDVMREHVPPGSWRRCLDLLDLAAR